MVKNWTSQDLAWFYGDENNYIQELDKCIEKGLKANTPIEYSEGETFFPIERAIILGKETLYNAMIDKGFYSDLTDDEKIRVLETALSNQEKNISETLSKNLSTNAVFKALSSQHLYGEIHGLRGPTIDPTTQKFLIDFMGSTLEKTEKITFEKPNDSLTTLLKTLILQYSSPNGDINALNLFWKICEKTIGIDLQLVTTCLLQDQYLVATCLNLKKTEFCKALANKDLEAKNKALQYWKQKDQTNEAILTLLS